MRDSHCSSSAAGAKKNLVIALCFAAIAVPQNISNATQWQVIHPKGLNIRTAPTVSGSQVIGTLKTGALVECIERKVIVSVHSELNALFFSECTLVARLLLSLRSCSLVHSCVPFSCDAVAVNSQLCRAFRNTDTVSLACVFLFLPGSLQDVWLRHSQGWSAIQWDGQINLVEQFGPVTVSVCSVFE